MLKGEIRDVSLPGLIQLLANETSKSYRIVVENASVKGIVIVSRGHVVSASYGLLEGEDALCEFLTWEEGSFSVERMPNRFKIATEKNIDLKLQQSSSFADQAAFLLEDNIGLNTVILPSKMFGSAEWQESSKLQPLQREDFLILGWLADGRTMRQAMREFAFDLVHAIGILYRLVLTKSVEIERASNSTEILPLAQEVSESLALSEVPFADRQDRASSKVASAGDSGQSDALTAVESKAHLRADVDLTDPKLADMSRRTSALPLVSIDMERLMKAAFTITEFGFLALKNPALDENIRELLLQIEKGLTIEKVVESSQRKPASTLSKYSYCLQRGYMTNPDSVLSLTADLLLGRTELDQYLLQRRRVTGESLRDIADAARSGGVSVEEMLVLTGFLLREDLDNLNIQRDRFAVS